MAYEHMFQTNTNFFRDKLILIYNIYIYINKYICEEHCVCCPVLRKRRSNVLELLRWLSQNLKMPTAPSSSDCLWHIPGCTELWHITWHTPCSATLPAPQIIGFGIGLLFQMFSRQWVSQYINIISWHGFRSNSKTQKQAKKSKHTHCQNCIRDTQTISPCLWFQLHMWHYLWWAGS